MQPAGSPSAKQTRTRGTILVMLAEPGYFRFYGSAITELARRGWQVRLAFDNPAKRGDGRQVPAGAGETVQSIGAVPAHPKGGIMPAMRAVVDYLRYLEPRFQTAEYLRRRWERHLPPRFAFLTRVSRLPRWVVSAVIAAARTVERLVPPDPDALAFVRGVAPDAVLVSPLVMLGPNGSRQTELVKAARTLRIPAVVAIASWDHLTSKGLVRIIPDALTVWNEVQAREAVELHRLPRGRIFVTGAQPFDHWFASSDPGATAAFRARLGIQSHQRVILFVGSSRKMAPGQSEPRFVHRWLAALRASSISDLREAFVIVRPHPSNTGVWRSTMQSEPGVAVYPSEYSGIPLREDEVEAFRQSLLVSDAVVGINTTAMIEAAILERPVLSVRDAEFAHSQGQTLHFGYLPSDAGGCALVAESLGEHVAQLGRVLHDPTPQLEASRRFVQSFVRPRGMRERATSHLCDAIEHVALSAAHPAVESDLDPHAFPAAGRTLR